VPITSQMAQISRGIFIFIVFLSPGLFHCSQEYSGKSGDPFMRLLPSKDLGEWRQADTPQLFKGEDLYLYINGGAEIYHEYGFKQVLVQDFKNLGDQTICLEIFEMTDDRGAFGIYSFKTGTAGEAVHAGNGGLLEDYYMNFWKGNFAVTLTGHDDSPNTVQGLKEIAAAVDALIAPCGKKPGLIELLPEEGLVKQSVTYLTGHLGLMNCDTFFSNLFLQFTEAVAGEYLKGRRLFILRYQEGKSGTTQFLEAMQVLETGGRYDVLKREDGTYALSDAGGRLIIGQHYGHFTIFVMGTDRQADMENLLRHVIKNIDEQDRF